MQHIMPPAPFIPWGTWSVFVVCAVMFAWTTAAGGSDEPAVLLRFGANQGGLTLGGQWWRLWGATFLHVGVLHLVVNMYALRSVGPPLEEALGTRAWLALYAVAGLSGSLTSAWMMGSRRALSAGASGAIFGLFGALAWLVYARRDRFPKDEQARVLRSMVAPIVLNLAIGYGAGFDNAAHLGGLAGGTAVMMTFLAPVVRSHLQSGALSLVLLTVGLLPFANEGYVAVRVVRNRSLSPVAGRPYAPSPEGGAPFSSRLRK